MTYSTSGLIEATDYNTRVNSLNAFLTTGSGNRGYGQTALGTVTSAAAATGLVRNTEWRSLFTTITNIGLHQGTTITALTLPVAGTVITALNPAVNNNLTTLDNNRLNASAQGTTGSSTKTNTTAWSGSASLYTLTMTSTVTFANVDSARYFFNGGGQIRLTLSHSGSGTTNINGYLNTLCSNLGTLVLSSGTCTIAGTNYTGTTKLGGGGTSTVATATGFYNLTGTYQQLITQSSSVFADYSSSNIVVNALYSGSAITFQINFRLADSDLTGSNPAPNTGTQLTTSFNPPSTTYLANVWGTPTIT